MILNFEIISDNSTLSNMFFASTIFITLVIARYATLAKLIRDTRSDIENGKIKYKSADEFGFHITHYNTRLKLLKYILFLTLLSGVSLCCSLLFILIHSDFFGVIAFSIHVILLIISLFLLVYELTVSFEALKEHLGMMKNLKDTIQF